MTSLFPTALPSLPLLLWETPPGLERILSQEGVAFSRVREPHPMAFQAGRFVLYDGRRIAPSVAHATLSPEHVPIDIDTLRHGERIDPFQAIIDNRATMATWLVGGLELTERVSRHPKADIRRRIIRKLQHTITQAGGVWARLSAFPFPFRSAFNIRADLDEALVDDYCRFARARQPLSDCCTHFVSTRAYGEHPSVLQDLLRFDTQSHGHHHVVYRDPEANRRNVRRAHQILSQSGFEPVGFSAPHGRWNAGLDEALEELGYSYSSDFQLGYDDLPFFPWRGDRFSQVLQIPVHPICEGLFMEAGVSSGRVIGQYLAQVVRAKVKAGEPAFVYGHPERRLGRFPEILAALEGPVCGNPLLWRVTLTEFAHWWRWRSERSWSIVTKPEGRLEVQFDDWQTDYPLGLEVHRGKHVASFPVHGPRVPLRLEDLAYERREPRVDAPAPALSPWTPSLKAAVQSAIDWETVTPLDELPVDSISARVKKGLRWWRHRQRAESGT